MRPPAFGLAFAAGSMEQAGVIAERLAAIVEEQHCQVDGIRLRLAFGVSELMQDKEESVQELMNRAVAAMEKTENPHKT